MWNGYEYVWEIIMGNYYVLEILCMFMGNCYVTY